MLIRSEFDIQFHLPQTLPIVAMLRLHPSLDPLVRAPEELKIEHIDRDSATTIVAEEYIDSFGNRCSRFLAPQGAIRVSGQSLVENDGQPDVICTEARQHPVEELPPEVLAVSAEQPVLPGGPDVAGGGRYVRAYFPGLGAGGVDSGLGA